jgi:hypothetical protein
VPQFGNRKQAPGIVYDSDLGGAIDTVLALALLHGFEGKTEARIAGLTIGNPSLKSAQLCDVIEKFYASAITGLAATFFTGAPIGLTTSGQAAAATPIATALLANKDVYTTRIRNLNDTAVPEVLIRNALTAQNDGSATVVLAGPATNLVRLLDMTGVPDLIQSKVRLLVFAGGKFPTGEPDPALLADLPAARRLFAEWPTAIVAAGREIGAALPFPGACIETDFAYAPAHPIAAAYRAWQPMPYNAPATAMAAVLYAARPKETYFKLSGPGAIGIGDDGRAAFHASSGGKHRYLIADPSRQEEILKIYTTLASAKPVARAFRVPAAVDDEIKKEQPDKP